MSGEGPEDTAPPAPPEEEVPVVDSQQTWHGTSKRTLSPDKGLLRVEWEVAIRRVGVLGLILPECIAMEADVRAGGTFGPKLVAASPSEYSGTISFVGFGLDYSLDVLAKVKTAKIGLRGIKNSRWKRVAKIVTDNEDVKALQESKGRFDKAKMAAAALDEDPSHWFEGLKETRPAKFRKIVDCNNTRLQDFEGLGMKSRFTHNVGVEVTWSSVCFSKSGHLKEVEVSVPWWSADAMDWLGLLPSVGVAVDAGEWLRVPLRQHLMQKREQIVSKLRATHEKLEPVVRPMTEEEQKLYEQILKNPIKLDSQSLADSVLKQMNEGPVIRSAK